MVQRVGSEPGSPQFSPSEAVVVAFRRESHRNRRPGARRLRSHQPRRGAVAAGPHNDPCGEDRGEKSDAQQNLQWIKAVASATSEAARSGTQGSGWVSRGPGLSCWQSRAAQRERPCAP